MIVAATGFALVTLTSYLVFFGVGWAFFMTMLYRDYEVRNPMVRVLFSATFTLSCGMFELIIFEIGDWFLPSVRRAQWRFTLVAMLALVIVVLPLYQFTLLAAGTTRRPRRLALAACLWLGYVYLFWKLGDVFPIHAAADSGAAAGSSVPVGVLDAALGRVGLVGVTLMAGLSGFGAVNSPFTTMSLFLRTVTSADVAAAERRLAQAVEMLASKKKKRLLVTERLKVGLGAGDAAAAGGGMSGRVRQWWSHLASGLGFDPHSLHDLAQQIRGLESQTQQLFLDYEDLLVERERIRYSQTWRGQYYNVLGHVFSLYCVYKIVMSVVNIVFNRIGRLDPVTHGLTLLGLWAGVEIDVAVWVQQVSFVFVGVLVLVSIRGLLVQLAKFFRVFSAAVSPGHVTLVLAQVMGVYFLSTVLMLRSSLPSQYRTIITDVIANLEFNFYQRWFDALFVLSAVASILFLAWLHQMHKQREREQRDLLSF